MEKNKNNVVCDFLSFVGHSWTWEKLTPKEKEIFKNSIVSINSRNEKDNSIKGTYKQRWKILNDFYYMFLNALNYNGFQWRCEK